MQNSQPSLLTRDDTLFGVCEALGEDFGFNANYLRVALAAALIWAPVAVLATYVVAGLLVAASRWAFPVRTSRSADVVTHPAEAAPPMTGENDEAGFDYAVAA